MNDSLTKHTERREDKFTLFLAWRLCSTQMAKVALTVFFF